MLSANREDYDGEEGGNTEDIDFNKIDIVQILLHPENADQNWKITAKEVLEARKLEECTFKPKILDYEPHQKYKTDGSKMTSRSRKGA